MYSFDNSIDFAALMGDVALRLKGVPNASLSNKTELRYGTNGSLSIDLTKGVFFDHEVGQGGGCLDLIRRELGHADADAVEWLRREGLLVNGGTSTTSRVSGGSNAAKAKPRLAATYDYVDEHGELLFQVCRLEPKSFRQRRPDGHGGWIWGLGDTRRVLYKLPELIEALALEHTCFVVEGEKDADMLWALNIPATTNSAGAGRWCDEYSEVLRGADVIVIPDHDKPGHDHAAHVAGQLVDVAARVRILDLAAHWPACPEKGDISNWLEEASGTAEALWKLVEQTPDWEPAAVGWAHPPPAAPDQQERLNSQSTRAKDKQAATDQSVKATPYVPRDPTSIPRRQFLYARHYIRGAVSGTVGAGGFAKSLRLLTEAIAMATGRDLLGEVPFNGPLRVWTWNGEDSRDEIERRVAGICQHYGINAECELEGQLFIDSGHDMALKLAKVGAGSNVIFEEHVISQIIATIRENQIDIAKTTTLRSTRSSREGLGASRLRQIAQSSLRTTRASRVQDRLN
jgi:hypothetical protein